MTAPASPWRVAEVRALPGYRLRVRFNDGTTGEVDMATFLGSDGAGVFAVLTDATLFARVDVVLGAVTWLDDLDLAPDTMYREIRDNGTWVVEQPASRSLHRQQAAGAAQHRCSSEPNVPGARSARAAAPGGSSVYRLVVKPPMAATPAAPEPLSRRLVVAVIPPSA